MSKGGMTETRSVFFFTDVGDPEEFMVVRTKVEVPVVRDLVRSMEENGGSSKPSLQSKS